MEFIKYLLGILAILLFIGLIIFSVYLLFFVSLLITPIISLKNYIVFTIDIFVSWICGAEPPAAWNSKGRSERDLPELYTFMIITWKVVLPCYLPLLFIHTCYLYLIGITRKLPYILISLYPGVSIIMFFTWLFFARIWSDFESDIKK